MWKSGKLQKHANFKGFFKIRVWIMSPNYVSFSTRGFSAVLAVDNCG